MHKITRAKALIAIEAAGTQDDQRAFLRLYTENRIALPAAKEAYARGKRLRQFVDARDAKANA